MPYIVYFNFIMMLIGVVLDLIGWGDILSSYSMAGLKKVQKYYDRASKGSTIDMHRCLT